MLLSWGKHRVTKPHIIKSSPYIPTRHWKISKTFSNRLKWHSRICRSNSHNGVSWDSSYIISICLHEVSLVTGNFSWGLNEIVLFSCHLKSSDLARCTEERRYYNFTGLFLGLYLNNSTSIDTYLYENTKRLVDKWHVKTGVLSPSPLLYDKAFHC